MEIARGVRANLIKTDKFKTNMVGVFFSTPMTLENASINALIPAVLRRGTNNYPTMKDISKKLEELYGAKFDCGISKKGENQVIRFYGEIVNRKFVGENKDIFSEFVDVIKDVIFNPALENGLFKEEYVKQEKEQVKDIIESRKNDKVQYALERCYEIMFEGEPYGVSEFGTIEGVEKINNKELVEAYYNMLKNYQVDIVLAGDITQDEFKNIVAKFSFEPRTELKIKPAEIVHVDKVKNTTEEFDINQGKLSLGFRVNIDVNTDDYYKMLVYNGILGGGVQSKLFQNVREKNSLAYYSFSRFEKIKTVMGISSGIEIKNYQKALDTILEQLGDMKKGNISEYEYNTTIKTLENSLNSMRDEQAQMLDFNYTQILTGNNRTLEDIIESIHKVTIDDVVKIAAKIELDTIYFMTGKNA